MAKNLHSANVRRKILQKTTGSLSEIQKQSCSHAVKEEEDFIVDFEVIAVLTSTNFPFSAKNSLKTLAGKKPASQMYSTIQTLKMRFPNLKTYLKSHCKVNWNSI